MNNQFIKYFVVVALAFSSQLGFAKDYRNQPVGDYSKASINLSVDRANKSFLTFMVEEFYDVIKSQAPFQTHWKLSHLDDIKKGIGAELKLADDVTTYHVKFQGPDSEDAILSGRSFGVVHDAAIRAGDTVDYIADASYFFYLSELEEVLQDEKQAKIFYTAIFKVLVSSDSSEFSNPEMEYHTKRVAADFVAVYVAELYRRLLQHDGEKVSWSHAWEEAHLQTTILGNFHAGQSKEKRGMFFNGEYMTSPYVQKDNRGTWNDKSDDVCVYGIYRNIEYYESRIRRAKSAKQKAALQKEYDEYRAKNIPWPEDTKTEPFSLHNYWQFGSECGGRSGVNVTRDDFEKLGSEITEWLNKNGYKDDLGQIYNYSDKTVGTFKNFIDSFAEAMSDNDAPKQYNQSQKLIKALVDSVMLIREKADTITDEQILN